MVEAEVGEPAEVECGRSEAEAEPVGFDADESDTAVAVGDEPGDGAFNERPVLSVAGDEVFVAAPAG